MGSDTFDPVVYYMSCSEHLPEPSIELGRRADANGMPTGCLWEE